MRANFVTETTEEKIPVWLICPPGVVCNTLSTLLAAADFVVKPPGETPPYAIIHVMLPEKTALERLPLPPQVPIYAIRFGTSSKTEVPGAINLTYHGVFAQTAPGLSSLDQLTRRLVFEEGTDLLGGECAPLLLEDACQHLAQVLLSGKPQEGDYSGDQQLTYTDFISKLRIKLGIRSGKRVKQVRVPEIYQKRIPGRDVGAVIEEIAQYYESLRPEKSLQRKSPSQIKRRKILVITSFAAGLVLALGYAWYQLAARALSTELRALAYETETSATRLEPAKRAAEQLNFLAGLTDLFFSWISQGKASDLRTSLPLLSAIIEGGQGTSAAGKELLAAFHAFSRANDKGDALALLKSADARLDEAYKNFSLVQARFTQHEVSLPDVLGGKGVQEQLVATLPEARKSILSLRSVTSALSVMLAGKHNYVLLLLDDTNLRGSGGAVSAVVVLSVDSGKLLTYQVYPTSVVNQMMTGQVPSPDEVGVFLRQGTWGLADSTWDYGFSKAAERISWFLSKELSRSIDGVITMPLRSLPEILAVIGPISSEMGDLTATGFEQAKIQAISKLTKDPGALESWQTKVLTQIWDKIIKADDIHLPKIAEVVKGLFSNSEMSINVSNPEAQRLFAALSWDGEAISPVCPPTFATNICHVSTVLETENSLGQNNVNAFVSRSHVHTIRMGTDVLLHNRILTLSNSSSLLAWPYGSYQVLVKFVIGEDALVQNVSINDQVLAPIQFSLLKLDGKLVVRARVEVVPGTTSRVKLLYTEPGIPEQNSSLVFFEQKQPGAGNDPFTLIITYPDSFTPKAVAPRAEVGRNSLTFTGKHDTNRLFGVGF